MDVIIMRERRDHRGRVLLNPAHPHFKRIELSEPEALRTDLRLIRE